MDETEELRPHPDCNCGTNAGNYPHARETVDRVAGKGDDLRPPTVAVRATSPTRYLLPTSFHIRHA